VNRWDLPSFGYACKSAPSCDAFDGEYIVDYGANWHRNLFALRLSFSKE
jgi:hypothetical protein